MYVVKLKYKQALESSYANHAVIAPISEIKVTQRYTLQHFFMSLREAKQLMTALVSRQLNPQVSYWGDPQQELDYISIVDISHYPPYSEFQVIDYREFK